jgi:hypothetical protein
MRSAAKLGLVVALLAGSALLGSAGTVLAQEDEELSFSSTCQQLDATSRPRGRRR